MPFISIIVPVYNTAPWLRRCLDSICAQSYRNLEIICVDDGSTDATPDILAEKTAKCGVRIRRDCQLPCDWKKLACI